MFFYVKMNLKISTYFLIAAAILVCDIKCADDKDQKKLVETTNTKIESRKDVKEKRQLDQQQIAIHSPQSEQSLSHQQQADAIFGSSQPNNFVLRAYNSIQNNKRQQNAHHHTAQQQQQQQQFLQSQQQQQQQQQQQNQHQGQPEQIHEAAQQQYTYLPEGVQQQRSIQQFRPLVNGKHAGPHRKPQSIRPVQLIQQIPQYSPHPYPLIPEEQLLKFLEEDLASKGIANIQPIQQQSSEEKHVQLKKPQHSAAANAENQSKQGLGSYRQPDENIEYVYLPQPHQQPVHQQHSQPQPQALQYYASPQIIQRPQAQQQPQPQALYSPAHQLDYQKSISNHPLAASSLEKEIEKLFASNKPVAYPNYEQPQLGRYAPPSPSLAQHHLIKIPKHQKSKNYVSTPAPTDNYAPSLVEFANFKEPVQELQHDPSQQETAEHQSRQYLPKFYQTRTQYLKDTSPPVKKLVPRLKIQGHQQPTAAFLYQKPQAHYYVATQPQLHHHHQAQPSHGQFVPIANPNHSKNSAMKLIDAPALQYEKPRNVPVPSPAPKHMYYVPEEQSIEQQHQQHPTPHPSLSTIFVAQGTGVHSPTPQPSHQVKAHGAGSKGGLRLPPPNGKPITQEEFQALVDAGYPVQAVPVPVPVPYEQYIKEHPEYKYQIEQQQQQQQHQQQQQQQHQHQHHQHQQQQQVAESNLQSSRLAAGGITYLRPLDRNQPAEEDSKN